MIPLGYIAKRIAKQRPDWLQAPNVASVYSVSDCVNDSLATYTKDWKHNGFWMFDSAAAIRATAGSNDIDIQDAQLFFYEAYESEFDGQRWIPIKPDTSFETHVSIPAIKHLEGFDIVTFCDGPNSHSPLSCNSVAAVLPTNRHCLLGSLAEAVTALAGEAFNECEPGPYRIYAVYSVPWSE